MRKIIFVLLMALAPALHAQYTPVATYGQVPIIITPGTYLRYGPANGPWFVKYYSAAKTITSWTAEFTTNPVPGGNVNTYVLSAFQLPLASNGSAQTITVAGTKITIPVAGNTVPPVNPLPGTNAYCGTGLAKSFTFNGTGTSSGFTGGISMVCN